MYLNTWETLCLFLIHFLSSWLMSGTEYLRILSQMLFLLRICGWYYLTVGYACTFYRFYIRDWIIMWCPPKWKCWSDTDKIFHGQHKYHVLLPRIFCVWMIFLHVLGSCWTGRLLFTGRRHVRCFWRCKPWQVSAYCCDNFRI